MTQNQPSLPGQLRFTGSVCYRARAECSSVVECLFMVQWVVRSHTKLGPVLVLSSKVVSVAISVQNNSLYMLDMLNVYQK